MIRERIEAAIADSLDATRGAGSGLARSAHEIVELSHAEPPAVAARAALLEREATRALLTATSLARRAGMLAAYGEVLRLLDEARAAEAAEARDAIEAEAATDARNYVTEGETADPATYAAEAFTAWVEDEGPAAYEPLPEDEARALYVAAFVRSVAGK